ncbi:hypothetical protein RND81_02G121600 [Saponaria officinalis]|uniref:Uncharacterized protein n=1 Tax=Saponaria officinalis TaxID=3572 RepID=A0AAW1MMC1_SAPOF
MMTFCKHNTKTKFMQHLVNMTRIKQSIMVKPSQKTPSKILPLSKLDMIVRAPKTHTNIFYIYDHPPSSKSPPPYTTVVETLKTALSKILVPFYPLAGRLQLNQNRDEYEINCNAVGALFVEAETNLTIKDLGDFQPSAELRQLLILECDYTRDLSLIPLLMVQVTRFKCGGVGLGYTPHHHVADGTAHIDFFAKYLRLAAGLNLSVPPVHDRIHVAPRDTVSIKFQHKHEFDPIVPSLPPNGFTTGDQSYDTTQSLFKISKQQIQVLKHATLSQAMRYTNKNNHKISTYAILASHIWRSVCIARGISYDQEVKLYIPVDGRSRLKDPAMPDGYFGNILFFSICTEKVGDIIHKPIWYVASKIQESIEKMDDEYLRSAIDYLDLRPGSLDSLMGVHKFLYPNLLINSWVRLPFYKADFGWGPPKTVGNCEVKLEGLSFLTGGSNKDDDISLAINLFSVHMSIFKKHLYNFTCINSSL